jgi:hypothetical protein
MKTREEVQALKESWRRDPCWELEDAEGFDEYFDELSAYREMVERQWDEHRQKENEKEKAEAEKLGLVGLYQKIKELEAMQDRQNTAITHLTEGHKTKAYNAMCGYDN